jgi:DSF synthase
MSAVMRAVASARPAPLALHYQPADEVLWINLSLVGGQPHNFSTELLDALQSRLDDLEATQWQWREQEIGVPVHYAIMASDHPRYFSVGGDLAFFRRCIERRDPQGLRKYALQCLDIVYRWAMAGSDVATIAVVQGRALGGGFEAALAANHIIAEEHAEFGFPEILFGLFPVSGGMSLLARRIGIHQAERMMRDGRLLYSARELLAMGVIDEVCGRGEGPTMARAYIQRHRDSQRARMMLQRAKLRMLPLDLNELRQVVDDWIETAFALTPKEMRILEALIGMQKKEFS